LANEEDIIKRKDERYGEIKEKLIGQTLVLRSPAASALPAFFNLITDKKTRAFLETKKDEILLLHEQSGRHNLRILKQSLWDFERLSKCFSKKHWANPEAVEIVLQVVLALSFEARAGSLQRDEFSALKQSKYIRHFVENKSKETSGISNLERKYPQVSFD